MREGREGREEGNEIGRDMGLAVDDCGGCWRFIDRGLSIRYACGDEKS